MKVIMYGAPICDNCVQEKAILINRKDVELDYRNIIDSTAMLKEFLAYRDTEKMFADIIKANKIGIPFYVLEDGTKTLDIFDYLHIEKPNYEGNSCALDGSGKC